ncbi:MAG: hypothetical protein K2P59_09985 [Acetatifactor sp.]|nr:hypothetical protein [Acetatifactor sp.]
MDVYAVRDLDDFVRAGDGSYDPGGKLTGLQEFSEEEFAARDIEAIKNPPRPVAFAGGPEATGEEMKEMAKEYEAFGLTYEAKTDQWYFNGEKVRYFRDILTSNGESLSSGRFRVAQKSVWKIILHCDSTSGSIEICKQRHESGLKAGGDIALKRVSKNIPRPARPGESIFKHVLEVCREMRYHFNIGIYSPDLEEQQL